MMVREFNPSRLCGPWVDGAHRQSMIAQAAYLRAQRRAFEPGHELEDWLAAEAEVDQFLYGDESPRRGVTPELIQRRRARM